LGLLRGWLAGGAYLKIRPSFKGDDRLPATPCKTAVVVDVNKDVMQVITEMTKLEHSKARLFVKLKGLGNSFAATFARCYWMEPH
jgi:hypothetical protein